MSRVPHTSRGNEMKPYFFAAIALVLAASIASADDFDGKAVAAAMARKDLKPAPRLPDGHPDLGNSKGSWDPPGVGDISGHHGGFAGTAQPDKVQDIPFLPWTKAAYEKHNSNVT